MTECDCCAHLVEIWREAGYFEYECGLDLEWTELYRAMEWEDCPFFVECHRAEGSQ